MEPLTIQELIGHIESRDMESAVRFEPATYQRITEKQTSAQASILARIKRVNRCSDATARMIYSTSWGEYQLMGFNLYADDSMPLPVLEFAAATSLHDATFVAFLKRNGLQDFTPAKLAVDQSARLKFSMAYNGSIAYEQAMLASLIHFGFSCK